MLAIICLRWCIKCAPSGEPIRFTHYSTTVSHDWGRLKRHTVCRMDFFAKNSLAPSQREARKSYAVWLLAVGHATRRSSVGRRLCGGGRLRQSGWGPHSRRGARSRPRAGRSPAKAGRRCPSAARAGSWPPARRTALETDLQRALGQVKFCGQRGQGDAAAWWVSR